MVPRAGFSDSRAGRRRLHCVGEDNAAAEPETHATDRGKWHVCIP